MFPFARFPGVDTVLGPEMRSTGEVMGIDRTFEIAFAKSQIGGGARLPRAGTVFVSVRDADKERILPAVKLLAELGFKVIATSGTQRYLSEHGVPAHQDQQGAGRPPAHRRRHQERRGAARLQHHRRGPGPGGFPLVAARRPLA